MQQATSLVTSTNHLRYELITYGFFFFHLGLADDWHSTNQVMTMGCVYSNTRGRYITWISDDKVSWTFKGPGMGPDPSVQISA